MCCGPRINVTKLFLVAHVQTHDKSDQIVKDGDVRFVFRSTEQVCTSFDQKQVASSGFQLLSFPGFACSNDGLVHGRVCMLPD
jgi:hypothetical protein